MSATHYLSGTGPRAIAEAHDILAGRPGFGPPLTCRWPRAGAVLGFVVFCHGLGASGGDYAALSAHWAAHGYLVIHPTFPDSIRIVALTEPDLGLDPDADLSRWMAIPQARERMHQILHAPVRWLDRLAVVGGVMAVLPDIFAATCGAPAEPLPGAIAGHSFGAYTAQLLAGAVIDLPHDPGRSFRDDRFAPAILLSAQGRDQQGLRDGSWDALRGPVLNVTGTLDRGAKGGDWRWKSEPFELAPPGGKYLAVIEDGDHHLGGFSDRDPPRPAQQEAVRQLTLAFLDAHLLGRPAARAWLASISGEVGGCPLLFKRK